MYRMHALRRFSSGVKPPKGPAHRGRIDKSRAICSERLAAALFAVVPIILRSRAKRPRVREKVWNETAAAVAAAASRRYGQRERENKSRRIRGRREIMDRERDNSSPPHAHHVELFIRAYIRCSANGEKE